MVKRCLLLLLFLTSGLLAAPERLKIQDVRPILDEMLVLHVEHKEMTPLLIKRAFKIYIEQFDPAKLYLLEEEVAPYLSPDASKLARSIERFLSGDLSDFIKLNQILEKAVTRSRSWRREIQKELVLNSEPSAAPAVEGTVEWAKTPESLKARLQRQFVRFLLEEKRLSKLSSLTAEQRAQILQLWQKRLQNKEENYLLLNAEGKFETDKHGESRFCLHTLRALAKSLDAHSAYFSPEEAAEMRTSLEKQFEGIGVVLREGIEGVVIADLVKGGPAEKSGQIAVGDLLIEIDGKPLRGLSYEQILDEMKNKGKRDIQLGLKRSGAEELKRVSLLREKIVMQDERLQATATPVSDGIIGKIVLSSFYEGGHLSSAEQDMREAIKKLKKQGNLKGLVLDLRENAGGFLSQAVKVAGLFITRGVVVISKYAKGEIKYLRELDGRIYYDGPLVVLTSKASASAAEIVAQALQDYGVALVVGDERTYGKGTIQYQTVTDEQAKAFFKVTVGRYYTVSGKTTQIEGVKADLVVPTEFAPYNIGEKFLEYPLPSDRVSAAYVDPLTDVEERSKGWLQKNYLPNLQKLELLWQKLLPALSANSRFRQTHDKNFVLFMKTHNKEQGLSIRTFRRPVNPEWGNEDLQMAEAVNILKDMIELRPKKG